jgi:predicted nucleic acid-binding protein
MILADTSVVIDYAKGRDAKLLARWSVISKRLAETTRKRQRQALS